MKKSIAYAILLLSSIPLAHAVSFNLQDGELPASVGFFTDTPIDKESMAAMQARLEFMNSFGPAFTHWQTAPSALNYIREYFTLSSGTWLAEPAHSYKNDATPALAEIHDKFWKALIGKVPSATEKKELEAYAKQIGDKEAVDKSRSFSLIYMESSGRSSIVEYYNYMHASHCAPLELLAPLIVKYKISAIHPKEAQNPIVKSLYLKCLESSFILNPVNITRDMKVIANDSNREKSRNRWQRYQSSNDAPEGTRGLRINDTRVGPLTKTRG